MDPNQVIFDISSDEDTASFDDLRTTAVGSDDDHDWLTELLENVDKERKVEVEAKADADDSSDEVVFVGEYIPVTKKNSSNSREKSKSTSELAKVVDDDDDGDCVVLEGDPDKTVNDADVDSSNNSNVEDDDDDDDVKVVSQKGQVACRDYPHSRHLCAKYPFSSTSHERHCALCHCFVCDSVAPCEHWGTGVNTFDHCHATDKEDFWKQQREVFRKGECTPLPAQEFSVTYLPATAHQVSSVVHCDIRMGPNIGTQNKVTRPVTIRACSSARPSVPNIISRTRNHPPFYARGRNGLLPRSVSAHVRHMGVHNTTGIQGRGQQYVSSNTMFKRPGPVERNSGAVNHPVYGSSNMHCAPASHHSRNAVPQATVNAKSTSGWLGGLPTNRVSDTYTIPNPSQPNMSNANTSTLPPFPEPYSQPVPRSNDAGNDFSFVNQGYNVVDPAFFDCDLEWQQCNSSSRSNQQPLDESIDYNGNSNPATVDQASYNFAESTEQYQKDDDYQNWFLTQSESVTSAGMNVFSPELPSFDAGMLCFDFETSWNGLAQA